MKFYSARQAWHEAYYTPEVSRTASAQEQMELGCQVQHSSKLNTCRSAVDHALAGVIQSTITMLPIPLQMVGHWLYAPIDTGAAYEHDVWAMVATRAGVRHDNREMWFLAHAAIHAYQDLVIGKSDSATLMNRPFRIHKWLVDKHGISIDSRRWCEKYKAQWNKFIAVLDEMDRKALGPVAAAIEKANEEVDLVGDTFVWGNQVVNFSRVMPDE